MQSATHILFPPYRLDIVEERLRRGDELIQLRHKPFVLLRYLAERPGQLVSKDTLLNVIRPDTVVGEGVLSVDIAELRKALRDNPRSPRFIETVHGRGYRFIGAVKNLSSTTNGTRRLQEFLGRKDSRFVGRERELTQLHRLLDAAKEGERRIVFLSGEPGIGKTTLVEAFLRLMAGGDRVWIGRGQCIDHYGSGEAYLPVLEAIGRMCREPDGQHLVQLLRRHAPSWLAQMPALVPTKDRQSLQAEVHGATRERMLREMSEALTAITAERPLVLRLEDLHWSDVSTLDLLAFVTRQTEPARLMIIGTYRPAEILKPGHPLGPIRQELITHGYCEEISLNYLTEDAVCEYLARRFDDCNPHPEVGRIVYERTDGNPLFMVNVIDDMVARDLITDSNGDPSVTIAPSKIEIAAPKTIEQMIVGHLDRLEPAERELLDVASVVGDEFAAECVAAGLGLGAEQVELLSDALVRREQFLRVKGTDEWPDGTITAVYGFIHALYREVIYDRLPLNSKARLHREIAARHERGYGDRAPSIATELATHFELGRSFKNAIRYRAHAGANAVKRSANIEAIQHFNKGIRLIAELDIAEQWYEEELRIRIMLGPPLVHTKGYASPEVEENYIRARSLWREGADEAQLHAVLWGLWLFYVVGAQHAKALELGRELLSVAEHKQDPALLTTAHYTLECTLFYMGQASIAYTHAKKGIAQYDAKQHRELAFSYAQDPGVICRSVGGWALWTQGFPASALQLNDDAVAHAKQLGYPFSIAFSLNFSAALHQMCGNIEAALENATAAITLCDQHGFPFWLEMARLLQGRITAEQGDAEKATAQMSSALNAFRATGAGLFCPHFLCLLAETLAMAEQYDAAGEAVTEALAIISKTDERYWEPEVHRIGGEVVLRTASGDGNVGDGERAAAFFQSAIETARQQNAKSSELRGATSLARLWQHQGKQAEAHQLLSEIYNWFNEGFDTKDLQDAKALLEELA